MRPLKKPICAYQDCWETIKPSAKSTYCVLHKKILKNHSNDLLEKFAAKLTTEQFTQEINKLKETRFIKRIDKWAQTMARYDLPMSHQDKLWMIESFASPYDEDGKLADKGHYIFLE